MKLYGVVDVKGTEVSDCYVIIGAMTVSADRASLIFNVSFHLGTINLGEDYFVAPYVLSGDNPETQAVDYLLSLSRFSKATKLED